MTTDPEDLSTQEWLYQISYQLEQQNQLLREIIESNPESDETQYKCNLCGEIVTDREQHMKTDHGMPEGTSYKNRYEEI